MRMIAGSILVLAACVLFSAIWIGHVLHNSAVAGSAKADYLEALVVFIGFFGAVFFIFGCALDRSSRSQNLKESKLNKEEIARCDSY